MDIKTIEKVSSRTYQLSEPGKFNEVYINREIPLNHVAIQPNLASICHADLRYFTGQRRPEALAKKLPMALLHEGIGTVVISNSETLSAGDRVVIVPNIPGYLLNNQNPQDCCPACNEGIGENYCYNNVFLGSGYDGIGQSKLVIPAACAIPVPAIIPDQIALLAELCSVSYRAVNTVKSDLPNAKIAVFGDGPVGYLTAAMLHYLFGVESDNLLVFGAVQEKLEQFQFAKRAMVQEYDFDQAEHVDIAIECTGGKFSESAINQAIDILKPGGHLVLLGVTEERVPINTRDILEKGISLQGSSRSSAGDFQAVIKAMENVSYQQALLRLIPDHNDLVNSTEDLIESMTKAAEHRGWKKTFIEFKW